MGLGVAEERATSVECEGTFEEALRLLLWLRTANRLLLEVARFEGDRVDDLYEAALRTPWEEWLLPEVPFHVHGVAQMEGLRDPRFAVLRCKDGIADRLRRKWGERPDAQNGPDGAACIAFYHAEGTGRLFLDLSGAPMSRRGWRVKPWKAPLRETLAASILAETRWNPGAEEALLCPMCGSGTLPIEAALLAQGKAPGLDRPAPAVLNLRLGAEDAAAWRDLRAEAAQGVRTRPGVWIYVSDIQGEAVRCAKENARRAGVEHLLRFATEDFRESPVPTPPGVVFLNPEYGERMGDPMRLERHYRAIGDHLKRACGGLRAYVLTGNAALGRCIGLKPSRRLEMYNGDLPCRLMEYALYEGTRDRRLLRKHGLQDA